MIKFFFLPFLNQDAPGGGAPPASPSGGAPSPADGGGAPPPGSPPASPNPSGDAGGEPTPKPWAEPKVADPMRNRTLANEMFGAAPPQPTPPKEYTQEAYAKYQQDLIMAQRQQAFREDITTTLSAPIVLGDGIALTYSSPEEINEFGQFVRSKITTGLTARDLVILHRANAILAMAQDQGARAHHAAIVKAREKSNITPGRPPTAPATQREDAPQGNTNGRVPSIAQMLKEQNPAFYADFMSGKVKAGDPYPKK